MRAPLSPFGEFRAYVRGELQRSSTERFDPEQCYALRVSVVRRADMNGMGHAASSRQPGGKDGAQGQHFSKHFEEELRQHLQAATVREPEDGEI